MNHLCFLQNGSNNQTDLLDAIIYVTIVLFILSVITEKFTQVVRMYPSKFRVTGIIACTLFFIPILVGLFSDFTKETGYLLGISLLLMFNTFCFVMLVVNTDQIQKRFQKYVAKLSVLNNVRKDGEELVPTESQKTKEKEVTILSFIVGFIVTYCFNANLFDLFEIPPKLGWKGNAPILVGNGFEPNPDYFAFDPIPAMGFVLTAFFLAFGSKFFHDLLDTLLQTKELKRKMNDSDTYQVDNIRQFDEYLTTDYYELARICLEQNTVTINALPNLGAYFIGLSSSPVNRRPVIVLHSTVQQNAGYPPFFQGRLDSGKIFTVKTEVVYGFQLPEIHLEEGDSISHVNFGNKPGTICCRVKDHERTYLLTCAHVMTGGSSTVNIQSTDGWINAVTQNDTESADTNFAPIGNWAFAVIDNEIDVALSETTQIVQPVVNINVPPANYTDGMNGAEVFVNGKLNKTRAFVQGHLETDLEFRYNGANHRLRDLILVSKNKIGSPVTATQGGDSGAMVYLAKDKIALGMVVGGNGQYTYLIPLSKILSKTKTQLT